MVVVGTGGTRCGANDLDALAVGISQALTGVSDHSRTHSVFDYEEEDE